MHRPLRNFALLALPLIASQLVGCANIAPGSLTAIQPVTEIRNPRVGQAYLFRGFIGVFSTGMNSLNDQLNDEGISAHVYQADQWSSVADEIEKQYKARPDAEPIVLAGHSYGADNVLRIAQKLKDKNVKIDLIVTLDAVTPPKVPANVKKVVNLYQSNGAMDSLPWLRGIPLEAERPGSVVLVNQDVRKDRKDLLEPGVNHFNIEKQEKIHAEVIKQIKQVCVTRPVWAMRRTPSGPLPSLTSNPQPAPTTNPSQARLD
jgi:pimeloyl-ACP methyl ester carboxylesterase